jgi:5-methylcytosine-specific restriction endonuclease McrA
VSRIPDLVIAEVHERAGDYCEACGRHLGAAGGVFHHRVLRSRGGRDETANLMEVHWVCHNGHTNSIHSRITRSERLGHIVPSCTDPATIAVITCADLMQMRA